LRSGSLQEEREAEEAKAMLRLEIDEAEHAAQLATKAAVDAAKELKQLGGLQQNVDAAREAVREAEQVVGDAQARRAAAEEGLISPDGTIQLQRLMGLSNADTGGTGAERDAASDPFCKVFWQDMATPHAETEVYHNEADVQMNYTVPLPKVLLAGEDATTRHMRESMHAGLEVGPPPEPGMVPPSKNVLKIEVWDHDATDADEFLGQVTIESIGGDDFRPSSKTTTSRDLLSTLHALWAARSPWGSFVCSQIRPRRRSRKRKPQRAGPCRSWSSCKQPVTLR
jgi:hypothetical protein